MAAPDDDTTRSHLEPHVDHLNYTTPQLPGSGGKILPPSTVFFDGEEPTHFGRYKVLRTLGSGGFGVVYLGFDDTLERTVAIKVPRRERVSKPEQIEAYLGEARLVANLEHPAIVHVYDCGTTSDARCYVVSQYIDGGDLGEWLKANRANFAWAAEVVVRIAEGLHHAHKSRIVHRDVKPANILLDGAGTPFLADFGLAMRESDFGRGSGYAGTPRYMSPEQARGEGHRVDGRSDIYSLGVVLYELLSGRVPFVENSITELLEQIQGREPPPLRLSVETLPAELDRIVMKSLAKRAADRYPTAADFADDLRLWLDDERRQPVTVSAPASAGETPGSVTPNQGETRPPRVVPKGLRAFDANDADFFLKLVPGPRDREGLPDSLRFWKGKLENPDDTFAVGLLYGPSGCGKSSFLRAGLLPRLSSTIAVVTVEATPHDTEARLLAALKKHRRDLSQHQKLSDALAQLRREPQGPILLVIDQFEQYLASPAAGDLVSALRQCDGRNIQALLLVRDDFWMAATRFFKALEIELHEGANSAAVDLFDKDHARKVLAGFGRAYSRLPAKRTDYVPAQNQFLDAAVNGLANEEGLIVCVRLAVFAEMVKGKPWEPATLTAIGGLEGVGVAFLEDTFGPGAAPSHRYHADAARAVLAALLPPLGTDIKKVMAPREALLTASGSDDFDALMKILDGELKLVTPAEDGHYQLTHDFLVPSLREWLTRRQKETRRGRAELLLAERASLWQAKPVARFLPSPLEWLTIRMRTKSQSWREPQRRMMRAAGRRYLVRGAAFASILAVATFFGLQFEEQMRAKSLVSQAKSAQPFNLPEIIEQMRPIRSRVDPLLTEALSRTTDEASRQSLRLVSVSEDPEALSHFTSELPMDDALRPFGYYLLLKHDDAFLIRLIGEKPNFLVEIPANYFASYFKRLERQKTQIAAALKTLLAAPPKPGDTDTDRRRSRCIAGLAILGDDAGLWGRLGVADATRSQLIQDLDDLGVDRQILLARYPQETNPIARIAILAALGQYDSTEVPSEQRPVAKLFADYRTDPDAGVHAALDWLLRRWGQELPDLRGQSAGNWTVNKSGQTFTLFRNVPYDFPMGANPGETERKADRNRHARRIERPFAMGSREVTVREMIVFIPEFRKEWQINPRQSPTEDCPATSVTWLDAARYCNELSRREGISKNQWCYEIEISEGGKISISLPPNFLARQGYRLPTETEWEFAARAGSTTSRHYGNDERLLGRFAWHNRNSGDRLRSVAQLQPNEFGLFDMLGNAAEWTLTGYDKELADYPADGRLVRDGWRDLDADLDVARVIRGGQFYDPPLDVRSARRFAQNVQEKTLSLGFRVARTLPQP